MADPKLYLRPIGFLYGDTAAEAVAEGAAFALAGGPISFTAAELIEGTPSSTERRLLAAKELAGSRDADLGLVLRRITTPRPPFAGLALSRPLIMGIVNVTPDSFSDGGLYDKTEGAVVRAAELAAAGADIVDIGGELTRPGSDPVEEGDELGRVLPVLEGLAGLQAAISIDTRKACVARAAARAGATIFNDVTALTYDPDSLAAAADTGLSVILMHAKGEPKTMHLDPRYDDVVLEVYDYLEGRIAAAEAVGIERARIAADPGIGFGKTMDHTLALARQSQPAAWARGAHPRRSVAQALHRRGGGRRNTAVAGARFLRRRPCGCGARCPDFARSRRGGNASGAFRVAGMRGRNRRLIRLRRGKKGLNP